MAKIYISYNNKDHNIAQKISDELKTADHEILIDVDTLLPGEDITSTLFNALRKSEIMIVIITKNSINSKWVQNEIGAALSYTAERPNFGFFPIVIGDAVIPDSIKHKLYIQGSESDIDNIAKQVLSDVNRFLGKREAKKIKGEENQQKTDDYINFEIDKLEEKQTISKRIYYIWNIVGFLTLLISASVLLLKLNIDSAFNITIAVKSIIIISFLIACSRYSFLMGKIALDESITLGERIHAISFGKVFIQMFGNDFTKEEMYKVFENWNTTPTKGIENYKAEDFDPNLIKVLINLVKVIKK